MDEILKPQDVLGPLEVGRTYRVPCLESTHLGWVPVIPFIHQDPELNNPRHHVHYDYRFMNADLKIALLSVEGKSTIPVLNTRSSEEFTLREMVCVHPTQEVDPCFLVRKGFLFTNHLDDACRGRKFNGKVCPHKGYSLEGIDPDADGVVTCPLHGSRWNKDGSYAGTLIHSEILLARYVKQLRSSKADIVVRLFSNEAVPTDDVTLADLKEVENYTPAHIRGASFRLSPRPRIKADVSKVCIEVHGAAWACGYYFTAEGWDQPLWIERFRRGCLGNVFEYPASGGTISISLLP